MASPIHSLLAIVAILCCFIPNSHGGHGHQGGFSVKLIPRDSPISPLYNPHETPAQRLRNAIKRSINRLDHFASSTTRNNTSRPFAQSALITDTADYLMNISIGTPPFPIIGIADTGSDIVWTQCKPCASCFDQNGALFDPAFSTTYKTLPCSSKTCASLRGDGAFCGDDPVCHYRVDYVDTSHTVGDLARDTLTLGSTAGRTVSYPNTLFGCGHDNAFTFKTAGWGIIGLGGGPASLVNQIGSGKFSYCLPRRGGNTLASTINFGQNAVVSGNGVVSTPLVSNPTRPYYYYLVMEGVSVGNVRVPFPAAPASSGGRGNIVIDSGTTFTMVPTEFLSRLSSTVDSQIVGAQKVADPQGYFTLCYALDPARFAFPQFTAHFQGADVVLPPSNVFVQVSDTVTCLGFHGSDMESFYGNVAQQNFVVGYDLQKRTVSFKAADCGQI